MKEYLSILSQCALFDGLRREELLAILGCLGARIMEMKKNQAALQEGDPAKDVGIVLRGAVQLVKEDYYGNRSIVTRILPGELFGESFACAGVGALPISVTAVEDSQVMLIDCRRITTSCTNACAFHNRMIFNLLRGVAMKNLVLNQKIEIIAKRTTREKLMTYLLMQAKHNSSDRFTIPYDRQELADYLGVERSAMSAEIGKLRKEGVIECEKSHFRLL